MHKKGEKLSYQQKRIEELEAELARYRDLVSSSEPIESENSEYLKRLKEIENVSVIGYWNYYINADKFERSEKIFDIYERTPEEFPPTFNGFLEALHPEDRLRIKEEFLSALDSGEALRTDYRIIVKEKRIKHLHLCCFIEKDASGKAFRAYGTTQDITESKIAEQELAESEARFRMVSDNSFDGIAMLEYDRFIYLSTYFKKLLNIRDDDLNKLHRNDLIARVYEEDRERVAARIKEAKINKTHYHKYEFRVKKKDGSIVWIDNSVTWEYDEQGVNCRTLINGRDITEQKALFEKLRKSEETFKTIFNESNAVKLIIDARTGKIEDANKTAVTFYGYPRETLITMGISVINTLSAAEVSEKMLEAENRVKGLFNFTHRLADGEIRNVRVYSAPFEIDGRKKLISHIYDITDRIEIEEELKESRTFLEETGNIAEVGGWTFDVKTGEGKWTEKLYHIYGMDSSIKPTIENTLKFYPPEVRHLITESFEKAILEGTPIDIELPLIDANGNHKWVHSIGRAVYENGEITKITGAVQDITRRKELQLDLEATMKALPDMLFELDLKGTIIDYKAPRTDSLYLPPEKFINKCVFDILPPEAAEIIKKGFDNFVQNGEEDRILYSIPMDGTVNWYEMAIAEKSGLSYENRRFICLARDITDRIEAEKELRESRELLNETGIMAKVGGWSFREGMDYIHWSEEVCLLFEVELNYKPTLEEAINYWHPDHRQIIIKAVDDLLKNGKSYDLELKIITAKENERWLHTIGRPQYEGGRIIGAKGIVQDITDRKALEIELRKSEANFKTLFNLNPDFVNIVRISDNKIVAINDYFVNQFGEKTDEIIGKTTIDLDIWVEPEQRQILFNEIISKGECRNFEGKFRRKDGSIFTGIISSIVFDFFGEPHILNVTRDISELKKAEQLLKELNDTKDKLFSIIGHDLKNPIHGIKGSASILLDRCEKKDCNLVPKLATNINKASNTALGILDDLLTWSKVQSGKLEKMPVNLSVLDTVNDTLLSHKAAADKKNIIIDINIDPSLQLFADLQMLSAIIRNLISNAIKFTHNGGSITIKAEEKKDAVEFCVKDTGVGLERDMISKLFIVGETISTNGTEQEEGTGLGLILCKEFVEEHNGKIWVESTPGESTSVYFTILV